jgi:D-arabinitol dehydrogenase (NADP+)
MKALQIDQPGKTSLVELKLPEPKPDEVLIKVMASGICGTDVHIFRGQYFGNYPVVPGHEFSGVIEKTGKGVSRLHRGARVAVEPNISCDNCYYCLNNRQNFCENWQAVGVIRQGGMAQYVIVPEKAAFDIGDLPYEQAAFMEPLSCVIHGTERLNLSISDRVLILGAGPVGQLLLQMIRLQGSGSVTVLEKQASRAELATSFGADRVITELKELKESDFDAVIDATGQISLMEKTADFACPGGKILLFGVPPTGEKLAIEGMKIFRKGLTLLSSFTSVRNSYQAISLLQSGQVKVSPLISHKFFLADFERGVELIERGKDNVKKVLILPQEQ